MEGWGGERGQKKKNTQSSQSVSVSGWTEKNINTYFTHRHTHTHTHTNTNWYAKLRN